MSSLLSNHLEQGVAMNEGVGVGVDEAGVVGVDITVADAVPVGSAPQFVPNAHSIKSSTFVTEMCEGYLRPDGPGQVPAQHAGIAPDGLRKCSV